MTTTKVTAIQARLEVVADALGVDVPLIFISDSGFVSDELLGWCIQHGASLDYIIFGDVRNLIRAAALWRTKAQSA